jgi:hypothetical protein
VDASFEMGFLLMSKQYAISHEAIVTSSGANCSAAGLLQGSACGLTNIPYSRGQFNTFGALDEDHGLDPVV